MYKNTAKQELTLRLNTNVKVSITENKIVMIEEILRKYPDEESCPFRLIMDHFGNKWSMIVIITLAGNGTMRFNELDKSIVDISQKMLTSTLQVLEKDGFIKRTIYPEVPPKVEYNLTELGYDLLPLVENVAEWAILYSKQILSARAEKSLSRK